jgi:hypothetical protein
MTEEAEIVLARHDERICDLEEAIGRVDKRVDKVGECVDAIKNNTNKILGGITVACILLALDIVMRFSA